MSKRGKISDPDDPEAEPELSPEEFAEDLFGSKDVPQEGLPPIQWLKDQFKTKSAIIRYLLSEGFGVNEIAKHTGFKYQHVRNVGTNPLKRGANESWLPKSQRQPLEQPLIQKRKEEL